ncbi:MAG: FG-GAP-like repeat-containing protein, partial [Polaribacter sp.]
TPDGNQLLRNNGDGTFTDKARDTNTEFNSVGWGAVFLDADNDAELDLYVSGEFDGSISSLLPSAFYHNQGNDTFEIPDDIGFEEDTRKSYSNAIGDIDNDGKPDIVVSNDTETNFLFNNKSTNANNWIKIQLEGTLGNSDGIGNRIEVFAGGKSQYRYTLCGEGYLSQNSSNEFIGLGSASSIDYIKITWNHSGVVELIEQVEVNQSILIQEGNGIILGKDAFSIAKLNVFPIPSRDGVFHITSNTTFESIKLAVYTITGKFLFSVNDNDSIDISSHGKGIYLVKIITDNQIYTKKLLYL